MGASGEWIEIPFLADCGADRTVISIDVFDLLGFPRVGGEQALEGVGGSIESFEFRTVLRIRRSDGVAINFRGQFAAVAAPTVLDMSVLGRDITNLLALVIDRPGSAVCLLSPGEIYRA